MQPETEPEGASLGAIGSLESLRISRRLTSQKLNNILFGTKFVLKTLLDEP